MKSVVCRNLFYFLFFMSSLLLLSSDDLTSAQDLLHAHVFNENFVETSFKKDLYKILIGSSKANIIALDDRYQDKNIPMLLSLHEQFFVETAKQYKHQQALVYLRQNGIHTDDAENKNIPKDAVDNDWRWEYDFVLSEFATNSKN